MYRYRDYRFRMTYPTRQWTPKKWEILSAINEENPSEDRLVTLDDSCIVLNGVMVIPKLTCFWLWSDPPREFREKVNAALHETLDIEGEDLYHTLISFMFYEIPKIEF